MAFITTYQAVGGYGRYAGSYFQGGAFDSSWNWLHTINNPDIRQCIELDASYIGVDYKGGCPMSGIELSYDDIRGFSQDANNPTPLFAILVTGEADLTRELILVDAVYNRRVTWLNASAIELYVYFTHRVYTDPTTYTDTVMARGSCLVMPPTDYTSHTHLEFFKSGDNWVAGVSSYCVASGEQKSKYTLWYPTPASFETTFNNKKPKGKDGFSPEYGPESEPGGYGPSSGDGGGIGGPAPTFNDDSDPWTPSVMPPSISALGFLNLYKCNTNALVNLGAEMYPEIQFPTSLTDVGPVIAAISDSIWNSRLIDFIVSIHMIPCDVTASQTPEDIKLGVRTMLGIQGYRITDDYVDVNLGDLKIDEYYTSFADYMTRCRLFLPFYGFVTLKPEYWQSATLNVKYRFNCVDGSFIATVTSTVNRHQKSFTAMVGQYSGSACIHLPATGASYASIFSGLVSNAGGAAVGMASGNVAAAGTSIMNTAAALGSGGEMHYSNPYNASASIMGQRFAYVIIERPVSHFSTRYAVEKGIPLLVAKTIGSCLGFTTAEDAILDGIPCTSEEKRRIKDLLKAGIIIKSH